MTDIKKDFLGEDIKTAKEIKKEAKAEKVLQKDFEREIASLKAENEKLKLEKLNKELKEQKELVEKGGSNVDRFLANRNDSISNLVNGGTKEFKKALSFVINSKNKVVIEWDNAKESLYPGGTSFSFNLVKFNFSKVHIDKTEFEKRLAIAKKQAQNQSELQTLVDAIKFDLKGKTFVPLEWKQPLLDKLLKKDIAKRPIKTFNDHLIENGKKGKDVKFKL